MSDSDVSSLIERYEWTYYNTIRMHMAQYADIIDAFPDFVKGTKHLISIEGTDGGVVIHTADSQDMFESYGSEKSVRELSWEQGVSVGFPSNIKPGSFAKITFSDIKITFKDQTNQIVHKYPWQILEVWTNFAAHKWSEDTARLEATNDALTFVAAHHMALAKGKPADKVREDVTSRLEDMIRRFKILLESRGREEEIQQFLTQNPTLLAPMATQIQPKVKLGSDYVTDFVIHMPDDEYVLVEIEQANHPLYTKAGNLSKEVVHAQRQVKDWRTWIADNISYARDRLPNISEPEAWVIIGRGDSLSRRNKQALRRENKESPYIKTLTYDDLIDHAKAFLRNLNQL